jgi:hypothetical protein
VRHIVDYFLARLRGELSVELYQPFNGGIYQPSQLNHSRVRKSGEKCGGIIGLETGE